MDAAEYRRRSRQNWGSSAAGWQARADDFSRVLRPVSAAMVEAVAPQPGDTLLELAAGPGDVGFLAAAQIEPGGELICTDFAPEMVEVARRRGERLGITNARYRQEDGESLTFDAASVDGVLCRFGYMLMADSSAAMRETRRVLRPGRRVALAVWKSPDVNPWMSLIGHELARRGWVDPPDPEAPGPFTWSREDIITRHFHDAGFVEHEVKEIVIDAGYGSFEEWLQVTGEMSSNFRNATSGRSSDEIDDLHSSLRVAAEPFRREDGSLAFPGHAWVAWAS